MRVVNDDCWAIITIVGEARGEPFEGKLAVAEVIRNRMMHKYSSHGDAVSTVLWPLQFSCWNANDHNRIIMASIDDTDAMVQDCIKAWNTAVRDASDSVNQAVLYYNPKVIPVPPAWVAASMQVARVGEHVFYRPAEWV